VLHSKYSKRCARKIQKNNNTRYFHSLQAVNQLNQMAGLNQNTARWIQVGSKQPVCI